MLKITSLEAVCEIEDASKRPREPTLDGSDQVFAYETQSADQLEIGQLGTPQETIASALSPEFKIAQQKKYLGRGTSVFFVEEFANLSDGRRILLRDDRGWYGWPANAPDSSWKTASGIELTSAILRVLEPDEEEWAADKWIQWIIQRMRFFGIVVDPASVHAAPLHVDFGPLLKQELRSVSPDPPAHRR